MIVEQDEKQGDKMRHLPQIGFPVKIFPSVREHNVLIVLHKYLHHLFPAGNSSAGTLALQIAKL